MECLELRDVVKYFKVGNELVRGVNGVTLEVARGEVVAVGGPSGAGKTTLLELAAGLLTPDEGSVSVAGVVMSDLKRGELVDFRRRTAGYVPQQVNLVPTLPALDNAAILLVAMGSRMEDARKRALPLLERMGMGARLDHLPEQLSGGERQRVGIARALVHDPELLLLDEPTNNLHDDLGPQVLALLDEVRRQRRLPVLIVTRDPAAAEMIDRTVRLDEGTLVPEPRRG